MPDKRNYFVQCRKKLGLSQKQLGDLFNVSDVTIRNIESGRNRTSLHFEFAKFFNEPVFKLFPDLEPMFVPERPECNGICEEQACQ